jgi:acyl dehydratase
VPESVTPAVPDPARAGGPWWLEDFAAGQRFTTPSRTLTAADVSAFAALTWDTNPMHTDREHAGRSRFGGLIGHGLMGVSFAMGLVSRLGVFEGSSVALLGIDDWTFSAPLVDQMTVRCELEILSVRRTRSGNGVLDRRLELWSSDGTLVQSGRIGLMVAPRP